ncbi:hypothetical protein [Frankia sp. CiP3]|uniref:hypothetical protein n=1 Tax=Frankia sp. CiP3 TaxID=2880971 RepID=UPI001EF6482A|nr:hypothetical protein [Frankia sp. CiP3]
MDEKWLAPVVDCACGCGEPAGENSRYAGGDERERMRHRARLQYARRRAGQPNGHHQHDAPAENDVLARLGLTDMPLAAVAERLAVFAGDLGGLASTVARRAGAVDEAAIARQITDATANAVSRAEAAEDEARRLRATLRDLQAELHQARRDRDQADADASVVAEAAAQADTAAAEARDRAQAAERDAEEALTDATQIREQAERARLAADGQRSQLERDHAKALAAVRADHTTQLAALHRDYARTLADARADHAAHLASERHAAADAVSAARDRATRAEAYADAFTAEQVRLAADRDRLLAEQASLTGQIARLTGTATRAHEQTLAVNGHRHADDATAEETGISPRPSSAGQPARQAPVPRRRAARATATG